MIKSSLNVYSASQINDYAARHYNGLMDYYADRWELFFDTIEDNGGKCNHNIVDKYKNLVETQVILKRNIYSSIVIRIRWTRISAVCPRHVRVNEFSKNVMPVYGVSASVSAILIYFKSVSVSVSTISFFQGRKKMSRIRYDMLF